MRITIQPLTLSGKKSFAICKVPMSLQDPGLFCLAGSSDNFQYFTSQQMPPGHLAQPGISIPIPHLKEEGRCTTPALLQARGMESHIAVFLITI